MMAGVRRVSRVEVASAFRWLTSTEDGLIIIRWLTSKFGFTSKSTLAPGQPDITAFHEGQRSVLIAIATQIEADLDLLAEQDRQQEAGSVAEEEDDEVLYVV